MGQGLGHTPTRANGKATLRSAFDPQVLGLTLETQFRQSVAVFLLAFFPPCYGTTAANNRRTHSSGESSALLHMPTDRPWDVTPAGHADNMPGHLVLIADRTGIRLFCVGLVHPSVQ